MKDYETLLKDHLRAYARERLGIRENGVWRHKGVDLPYGHILPADQWDRNFLDHCRPDILAYLNTQKQAKPPSGEREPESGPLRLHRFFHHLTSSQAFAINLFFPFLQEGSPAAQAFFGHFGRIQPAPGKWAFEHLPDAKEGTTVDVTWSSADGARLFCEVKLTEREFGPATDDQEHRDKLESTYRPRLAPLVTPELLERVTFFENYQILRNVALLHSDPRHGVAFLIPKENPRLLPKLDWVLLRLPSPTRERIKVVLVEPLMAAMQAEASLPDPLQKHAAEVAAKYVPVLG